MSLSQPSQLHQIRRSVGPTISGVIPDYPLPIGTPLGVVTVKQNGEHLFGLANGSATFATSNNGGAIIPEQGYLTRDSRSFPGLTDTEQLFGFGLETPFLMNVDGSIEPGHDLDIEGPLYILCAAATKFADGSATTSYQSGYAITSSTAQGTELTFVNGLFAVAQINDLVTHFLMGQLTPSTAGNVRIAVVKAPGYVKTQAGV